MTTGGPLVAIAADLQSDRVTISLSSASLSVIGLARMLLARWAAATRSGIPISLEPVAGQSGDGQRRGQFPQPVDRVLGARVGPTGQHGGDLGDPRQRRMVRSAVA